MKKNISININGIIFHIEEDGYNTLREYLDSIKNYFSSLDDDDEIVADIESRVAEILADQLDGGKQVITKQDIDSLVQKIGSIDDFKAATQEDPSTEKSEDAAGENKKTTGSKRLYRDQKGKIIGGVCAGMGHYFGIDSVWLRLLFIILAIGSVGTLVLIYLILWIAIPASRGLEAESSIKKMYRDPDNKMVGGVASGIAAFLGIDVVFVRILFLISVFVGGSGLLAYIILWIILPEAKSLTEKMQMQGEPVTLSNIESAIKKKTIDEKEESKLAKIILFPIRLAALILNKVAKIAGALIILLMALIRVLAGVVIIVISALLFVLVLILLGIGWGLISFSSLWEWGLYSDLAIPAEALSNAFPLWLLIPISVIVITFLLFILLSGISILSRRNAFKPIVSWSLAVALLLSIAILAIETPQIALHFRKDGSYKAQSEYVLNRKTPVLQLREAGMEDYPVISLKIIGHADSVVRIVKIFEAQGSTRKDARANAKMVTYHIEKRDSTFVFDSNIIFKKDALFRAQRIQVNMYMPFNKPFKIDADVWEIIDNYRGYDARNCDHNIWQMTPSGIVCYKP